MAEAEKRFRGVREAQRGGVKRLVWILTMIGWLEGAEPVPAGHPDGSEAIDLAMVIRGGVSLGAYEAGYSWAMIRMLAAIRERGVLRAAPNLRAVAGASAGSINALLSAMYWCQDPRRSENNTVERNLFYATWVDLGLEDLLVPPDDTENRSTLFSRRVLERKADAIIRHLYRPVFREGCEVALGFSVTKASPIVVEKYGEISIDNQAFSIPLTLKTRRRALVFESRKIPQERGLYTLEIPGIESNPAKVKEILFASSAFPGAFTQVKLRYRFRDKTGEGYFIDGGVYNNTPLDLAIALDRRSRLFLYLDPDHLRKRPRQSSARREQRPVGFLSANLTPLAHAADIYQKMSFYQAIRRYFRGRKRRRLILSSRYHPLTAGFLEHFGAFLDRNFRLYDYHVGVYDAIDQLAKALRKRPAFRGRKQTEVMDRLARHLGVDQNREARTAYRFFKATEYGGKRPPRDNRYAAIYYAFAKGVAEEKRYSVANFKYFLGHLDLRYLPARPDSFLSHATRNPDEWYKRPLRYVINRITALENYHAEIDASYRPVADLLNLLAWGGASLVRRKEGLEVQEINAPGEKRHAALREGLRLLPKEVAVDVANGGVSFAYEASFYKDMGWIDGFQFRGSYNFQPRGEGGDFLRFDADVVHRYNEALTLGFGVSGFGNVERAFWDRQSAYGVNAYVDLLEVLRATYVWRNGEGVNNHSLYLGIENLPSLLYWMNR